MLALPSSYIRVLEDNMSGFDGCLCYISPSICRIHNRINKTGDNFFNIPGKDKNDRLDTGQERIRKVRSTDK